MVKQKTSEETISIKKILKSKTMWLSIIMIASGVLTWLQGQIDVGASITVSGVLMAVMRIITKNGLAQK